MKLFKLISASLKDEIKKNGIARNNPGSKIRIVIIIMKRLMTKNLCAKK
jgi:hypothetical protein